MWTAIFQGFPPVFFIISELFPPPGAIDRQMLPNIFGPADLFRSIFQHGLIFKREAGSRSNKASGEIISDQMKINQEQRAAVAGQLQEKR